MSLWSWLAHNLLGRHRYWPVQPAPVPAAPDPVLVPVEPVPSAMPAMPRLHVEGRSFVTEDGTRWLWRGITAFRLLELAAHGRRHDAELYLMWAKGYGLTVVRVLAMAKGLFELSPEDGRDALPWLLETAARYGLRVEVVALADTASYPDLVLTSHVRDIGGICAAAPNALLQISNEAAHPSQQPGLSPDMLMRLAAFVSPSVLVTLAPAHGANDEETAWHGGAYGTIHGDRADGDNGWRWVRHSNEQRRISEELGLPIVNDEPRRDDLDPAKHRALSWLEALFGLGGTFHYVGGLHAQIPDGAELATTFAARLAGWRDIPAGWQGQYRNAGHVGSPVKSFTGAVRVYSSVNGDSGYTFVLGATPELSIEWNWPRRQVVAHVGTAILWSVNT